MHSQRNRSDWWEETRYKADFSCWVNCEIWTMSECVLLSVGIDPGKVRLDRLLDESDTYPFIAEVRKRWLILKRAARLSQSELATRWVRFLHAKSLNIPDELLVLLPSDDEGAQAVHSDQEALQKVVGGLCLLLAGYSKKYVNSGKINVSQIANSFADVTSDSNGLSWPGVRDRKLKGVLSEAVKHLKLECTEGVNEALANRLEEIS